MASAAEIKQLEAKIKEDVKQINELTKIVKALKHADKAVSQAAMLSLRRLLLFFLDKGDLKAVAKESTAAVPSDAKKPKSTGDSDAVLKFRKWLWGVYVAFVKEMLDWLLTKSDSNVQVAALRTLMEFVAREGEMRAHSGGAPGFGNETFMRVVQQLMAAPKLKGELASVFKGEYVGAYIDVQYYMLKNVTQLLESEHAKDESEQRAAEDAAFVANALRLLASVKMPESASDITSFLVEVKDAAGDLPEDELVSDDDDDSDADSDDEPLAVGNKRKAEEAAKKKQQQQPGAKKTKGLRSVKQHQHAFSQAWVAVLRHRLPQDAYKKILVQLPDEIMPHLVNPLLLSDFLTDSYSLGGVTSLLALNSLFILIQDYNFDYPDFYNKLYRLLDDPSLLSAKQRNRFFGLVELFLSSTHLPAYMVAAFAKRFSRLALVAEPGAIMFIIPMVYNLILRHKECLQLIHRTGVASAAEQAAKRRQELSSANAIDAAAKKLSGDASAIVLKDGHDPFVSDEQDPLACNALQSSLWELHTMKHHYNAEVALKATLFEEKLRHAFLDLDDVLDISYKSIFDKQLKRKEKGKVPLAFEPCTALFTADDGFARVFAL